MLIRVSEHRLIVGILFLIAGIALLVTGKPGFSSNLISEKELLIVLAGIGLVSLGGFFLYRAFKRVNN